MKVGKAIYNILSESTDVQSNFPFNTTDYAPTGTELVKNGSFTNGVEKVTNGDFLSGTDDWTIETAGGSSISVGTHEGRADVADIAILIIGNGISIRQPFTFVDGASYKVVVDVYVVSGSFRVDCLNGLVYGDFVSTSTTGSWQTLTGYITAVSSGSDYIWLRSLAEVSQFYVDSISVELLGEDWGLQNGWSISSGAAEFDGTPLVPESIYQTGVTDIGKNYKISYTITSSTNGSIRPFLGTSFGTSQSTPNTYTEYFIATGNENIGIEAGISFVGSITNISIEEMALTKIFPELAPPNIDAPYVVYSVVSNSPSETKNKNGNIDVASIEVYGFQDTYNKAVDLGVSVRAALDRKTGTYNTIEIQSTNYVNEQMDVNEARKLWAAIQDYSIRIKHI